MWITKLWRRLAHLLRRRRFDHELAEEMRLHVDLRAERLQRQGLTAQPKLWRYRKLFPALSTCLLPIMP